MASTTSSLILSLPKTHQPIHNSRSTAPRHSVPLRISASRRDFLVFTATTSLTAITLPFTANAKNIPLFGLRKKLEKAEEIIEEGIESAEKGLETAEKRVVEAEKEIEAAAEGGGIVGRLTQAGIVAAAEVFGVVVATSIVNGILGPEPKRS
ncbi:uncharacterized protein LOC141600621 [Silene latifolia]|uniref:uncharacterized protein LOC141600621 n=1 Tax=Silene latifolia TaxID=37657 RepID=UPI003D77A5F6